MEPRLSIPRLLVPTPRILPQHTPFTRLSISSLARFCTFPGRRCMRETNLRVSMLNLSIYCRLLWPRVPPASSVVNAVFSFRSSSTALNPRPLPLSSLPTLLLFRRPLRCLARRNFTRLFATLGTSSRTAASMCNWGSMQPRRCEMKKPLPLATISRFSHGFCSTLRASAIR
eukprot:5275861-Pleurochrysis_carterae.AAC.3